ncbi:acyl-CoA dehydrogenase NM domain-like protein [Aspergillus coremiiformis]|uniref:Acyl-CoA dehydrogenase NM domain-like protein n=1 Tax=Aspergillus coremiiformis TaxID=138285 RepID=A0A5N6Z852_9EURO|nr:acyl-CoA dehydrogenase NM domain-like protein [Aspergillus coremiiformis]
MSVDSAFLLDSDLFKIPAEDTTRDERISISYRRARAIAKAYAFRTEDILHLTDKFWQLHQDLITTRDSAAITLLTIQYNLCAGILAPFLNGRADLHALMQKLLTFEVSWQFLLTEVGHGLDAQNLETVATLLPGGDFDLHTPHPDAAKYMPPTSPIADFPRVGIVIARLVVHGEDRGVRPFIVWLNNGREMCKGVSAQILPGRAGSKPLDHCITTFHHVQLPHSALLGTLEKPQDPRKTFQSTIWRVPIGTLSLSTVLIPILKRSVYVAGTYSLRRHIRGSNPSPRPIISFRTQQRPILHTLAQIAVFEPYAQESIQRYKDRAIPHTVRQGIAIAFKAVVTRASQESLYSLAERCGAQGLFEYNNIIENQLEARGNSIAEGDIQVLSIKLATELLLGRYAMPSPRHPSSLLAGYEARAFETARDVLRSFDGVHRTEEFNMRILPRCQTLVESVGHRMAYEAALDAAVPDDLLALYEASVVLRHSGWFVENAGLGTEAQLDMEMRAMNSILPRLEHLLHATGAERYCTAPIVSDASWRAFTSNLAECEGNAILDLYGNEANATSKL